MTQDGIKSMQLYPRAERILVDLKALGFGPEAPLDLPTLNRFDQLHYHGVAAVEATVDSNGITSGQKVLEIGGGWGGCSRVLAERRGAHVDSVELQEDYNRVADDLTRRAGLSELVKHICADFNDLPLTDESYDHAVSWLALFHMPNRAHYTARIAASLKPGGHLFAEDLTLRTGPPPAEADDFKSSLFPQSLVNEGEYEASLRASGFVGITITDMTTDWTAFTAARLDVFRERRAEYEAVHGTAGYRTIETFYTKMAGYLAKGYVGGVRVRARKPVKYNDCRARSNTSST